MAITNQSVAGNFGYRHQLDRARRFLTRMEEARSEIEAHDMAWAFFQNCWHVNDWLSNDPFVSAAAKEIALKLAHASTALATCHALCDGTKHLGARPGASHHHVDNKITPGGPTDFDCLIDDGNGQLLSGKRLAHDCIAEWEHILRSQGLATARLS
jgi:hypothetical protein